MVCLAVLQMIHSSKGILDGSSKRMLDGAQEDSRDQTIEGSEDGINEGSMVKQMVRLMGDLMHYWMAYLKDC